MAEAAKPDNEEERLAALYRYDLLDRDVDTVFDTIIRVAADVCDVEISVIALIDRERQYFLARNGMKPRETSRAIAFCAHAILKPHTLMEIPDATKDPRFRDNPLVTGEIGVRFYAAIPLTTSDGHALGGLCLIGKRPKSLDDVQRETLQNLANVIMTLFDARISALETANQLIHIARHDELTGLPNRRLFEDRLDQATANARRHGQQLAIHFLDLNRFKEVNDTLGHGVGDELLKAVADILSVVIRDTDTVARFGGDEFTIIQTELDDAEGAAVLARKIVDAFAEPIRLADHEVRTGATIGVALYPADGKDAQELLQHADIALYAGKEKGQNTYEFFDAEMRKLISTRRTMEQDLERALEREEFIVHYQPRIELATGSICGVEALVRWQHPDKGVVPPGDFIPVAETSGLIRPLGEWVLRTACDQLAAWRAAGLPPLSMAVNLSAAQFHQSDIVALVEDVLDVSGLAPHLLELEITETMMMRERDTKVVPALQRLHDLGVKISIDDFGTGFASLTYLRQFPVSKVKVDQTFVQGITHARDDKAIVESVIRLGHGLNLEVTAEGVESQEQVDLLKAWNCDEAQGFHFSRPVAAEALTMLLEAQAAK